MNENLRYLAETKKVCAKFFICCKVHKNVSENLNMLISLRSTKGIYPSAPVVNKNHCQKKMDADAFSQLLQLQFFQFAQVAEQFLVKSVTQPFSISKTEK